MTWGWITDHWRLKLLSLGLALVLFGTVAFAQNPVQPRTFTVKRLSFEKTDPNLVVIQPPTKVPVTVFGLKDAVNSVDPSQITVTFDLTHISAPKSGTKSVNVTPQISVLPPNVSARNMSAYALTIDSADDAVLQIDMRVQPAPGWQLEPKTSSINDPNHGDVQVTSVHLHGPESLLDGLQAFVEWKPQVGAPSDTISGVKIQYENKAGTAINWPPPTFPLSSADLTTVDITIGARQVSVSKQVPVTAQVTGVPACGYEKSGLDAPDVTLTGPPDLLASIQSIPFGPTVSVAGASANVSETRAVSAGTGVKVAPSTVTVTVVITKVFDCTPATPPPPSPTPSPAPTPT